MSRQITISVREEVPIPRELPDRFKALKSFFPMDMITTKAKFDLRDGSPKTPVVRELGVMIRKTLLTRRGQVLRIDSMSTQDEHIIPNMLSRRLADVPLDQTELGTVFELNAQNDTPHTRIVWTGEFRKRGTRGGEDDAVEGGAPSLPFPRKSQLFNLSPGQSLKMVASVREADEPVDPSENPGGKLAIKVAVVPVDQGVEDSLVAEPTHYMLVFQMNFYTPTWELRRTLASASSRLRQEDNSDLNVSVEEGGGYRVELSPDVPPGSGVFLSRLIFAKDPKHFVTFLDINNREVIRLNRKSESEATEAVRDALKEAVSIIDSLLSQLPDGAK